MKALTLHQPLASLIAIGIKTIETRSWSTRYRGRLAIHSSASIPGLPRGQRISVGDYEIENDTPRGCAKQYLLRGPIDWPYRLPLGAIVATCELMDVVPITHLDEDAGHTEDRVIDMPLFRGLHLLRNHEDAVIEDQRPYGDFRPGRFAWLLSDIKPTTERCPLCWGTGTYPPMMRQLCALCRGKQSCESVPAKGKQGLWEWSL